MLEPRTITQQVLSEIGSTEKWLAKCRSEAWKYLLIISLGLDTQLFHLIPEHLKVVFRVYRSIIEH